MQGLLIHAQNIILLLDKHLNNEDFIESLPTTRGHIFEQVLCSECSARCCSCFSMYGPIEELKRFASLNNIPCFIEHQCTYYFDIKPIYQAAAEQASNLDELNELLKARGIFGLHIIDNFKGTPFEAETYDDFLTGILIGSCPGVLPNGRCEYNSPPLMCLHAMEPGDDNCIKAREKPPHPAFNLKSNGHE